MDCVLRGTYSTSTVQNTRKPFRLLSFHGLFNGFDTTALDIAKDIVIFTMEKYTPVIQPCFLHCG